MARTATVHTIAAPLDVDGLVAAGYEAVRRRDIPTALRHFKSALAAAPKRAECLHGMGIVALHAEMVERAREFLEAAVEAGNAQLDAQSQAQLYADLGQACYADGAATEAVRAWQRANELYPDSRYLEWAQEVLDQQMAKMAPATEKVSTTPPGHAIACIREALHLPPVYESQAAIDAARERYATGIAALLESDLELAPGELKDVPLVLDLVHQGGNDRDLQRDLAAFYRRACPALAFEAPHIGKRRATERIRVGVLSAHLCSHPVGAMNAGFVAKLDRSRFEVLVIRPSHAVVDEASVAIDASADGAIRLPADFIEARQRLAELALDVLYLPDPCADATTYFLAMGRHGRVQCAGWGHPVTTGIGNVDWFVSSRSLEPREAADHYTEKLALLALIPTWHPRPAAPEAADRSSLGLAEGATIYLCPHPLEAIHPDFDALAAGILRRDPRADVVLVESPYPMRNRLFRARLQRSMPDVASRVRFLRRPPQAQFLSLLAAADVLLDVPHSGLVTTAFEGFVAGTPIVTLPSALMRSRVTVACYEQMGFTDPVARDAEHYVDLATRLASDLDFRQTCRMAIAVWKDALLERDDAVVALGDFFEQAVDGR